MAQPHRCADAALRQCAPGCTELVAPKAEVITLPKGVFATGEEAEVWVSQLEEITRQVIQHLKNGTTVVVQ